MNNLHTLAIATSLSLFTLGAHAADNFAGLTWGKSTVNCIAEGDKVVT